MNKCDLEEMQQQVDRIILAAIEDESKWAYCTDLGPGQFDVWGTVRSFNFPEIVFEDRCTRYAVMMNGIRVRSVSSCGADPLTVFVNGVIKKYTDQKNCEKLLQALSPKSQPEVSSPARPWWKFWA